MGMKYREFDDSHPNFDEATHVFKLQGIFGAIARIQDVSAARFCRGSHTDMFQLGPISKELFCDASHCC